MNQSAGQACNAWYLSGPGAVSTKGNSKTEMPCFCSAFLNLPFLPASRVTTTWACCWHTVVQSWYAPESYTLHVCLQPPCQVTKGNSCTAENTMVCSNCQKPLLCSSGKNARPSGLTLSQLISRPAACSTKSMARRSEPNRQCSTSCPCDNTCCRARQSTLQLTVYGQAVWFDRQHTKRQG